MSEFDVLTNKLIDAAVKCGASKAAVIDGSQIVLSSEFRKICATGGCGKYDRCYVCPPDCGDIDQLMDMVRKYKHGLLYQYIGNIEDSFDIEGMGVVASEHAQLSQRIQKAVGEILPAGFTHLSCGGCRLCEKCAKVDKLPCRYPDKALISMEACGIDVYNTSKSTSLKYVNGANTVTYFGIVLFGE